MMIAEALFKSASGPWHHFSCLSLQQRQAAHETQTAKTVFTALKVPRIQFFPIWCGRQHVFLLAPKIDVSFCLLLFAGDTRHAASLRFPERFCGVQTTKKMYFCINAVRLYFCRDGACPVSEGKDTRRNKKDTRRNKKGTRKQKRRQKTKKTPERIKRHNEGTTKGFTCKGNKKDRCRC